MPWGCSADLEGLAQKNNDVASPHGSTPRLPRAHDHKCISVDLIVANDSNNNFFLIPFHSLFSLCVLAENLMIWSSDVRAFAPIRFM
jgi:hypothetical protein